MRITNLASTAFAPACPVASNVASKSEGNLHLLQAQRVIELVLIGCLVSSAINYSGVSQILYNEPEVELDVA